MDSQKRQIHRFFLNIGVHQGIFDLNHIREKQQKPKVQDLISRKGKWPYYRYFLSKRYGLNLNNKYEDMKWLCSKNQDQQWPVAYVILTFPNEHGNQERKQRIKNFLLSSSFGFDLSFLKTGRYKNEKCLNEPIQIIGSGILCSPHFQQLLKQNQKGGKVEHNKQSYLFLIQCRVKRQKIRITKEQSTWVINEPQDIRPYSIILLNSAKLSQLKTSANTYRSRVFLWSWHKQELQANQPNKMHQEIQESKTPLQMIDKLMQEKKEEVVMQYCNKLLNQAQDDQEQRQKSRQMETHFKQKAKDQDSESIIMLGLQRSAQQDGSEISFCLGSNVSTKISTKVHSTGFMKESKKFVTAVEKLNVSNTMSESAFLSQLKSSISALFKIDYLSVVIHHLTNGPNRQPIKVEWSTKYQQKILENGNIIREKLIQQVHPFFKKFKLSPQDFQPQGNIQFEDHKGKVFWRGGWPYFQPSRGKRYGIKAKFQYDTHDKDQKWIGMSGEPGQWAVAYHGLKDPNKFLSKIFEEERKNLKPGQRQSYSEVQVLNRSGQKVGNGVYCTPNFWDALCFTGDGVQIERGSKERKKYFLVFQCRVNPASIKVTKNDDYWVINDSKDIRPYGVILITEQMKKDYPRPESQFKQKRFRWKNYEKAILENMQKMMIKY